MTDIYTKLQYKFEKSCKDNSMQIIKHLLETPSLRKHIDININNGVLIKKALGNHFFELADYLLNQPEYNESHKIEFISEAFAMACVYSDMDLIKIIFNEEKYKTHLSILFNSTWCFRGAYSKNRKEVLEYLILESELEKSNPDVYREMYQIFPQSEEKIKYCESLFLQKKLSLELKNSSTNTKNKFKV